MNENNKIRWFLKQINILINDSVINNQSAKKLEDYYKVKLIEIKKKSSDNFIKVLKFCLLLLAALSIAGGIALVLINFNWQLLSKYFKTILSFLILVIPQGICAYILVRKKENIILKEVFSLVLSIMFGLSIAFIAQIYQISSSEEMFIFTWAVSTLVILYIFNSITSLVFYLLLIISLTSLMQIKGTIGLVFYPMFIMIIPFYIMEYRKKITARIKTVDYFMIISLVTALGISLEKNVPGLWIVAYSSLFVIFYLFGTAFEESEGNYFSSFKKLVMSPYKISGVIGTAAVSYMLVYDYFWKDIGWAFFRNQTKFNQIASAFDYSIAVLLPLIIMVLIFFAFKRKKKFSYPLASFAFAVIALYLLNSFLIKKAAYIADLSSALTVLFIIILSAYSFYTGYKNRSKLVIFLNIIFLYISIYTYFVENIRYDEFNILMNLVFHGYFGVMLYLSGVLIFNDAEKNKNKLSYFFKWLGIAQIAVVSYGMTFDLLWDILGSNNFFFSDKNSVFTFSLNIFIFLLNALLLFLIIKDKKISNYLIAAFGAIFHLVALFGLILRNSVKIEETCSLLMVAVIFILCVYSFWYGYKNKSSLTILFSSIFLFVLIITRFFYSEISVIINGLILIAIGVLLVFINLYFLKKIKKG